MAVVKKKKKKTVAKKKRTRKLDEKLASYPKKKSVTHKPKVCVGDSLKTSPLVELAQASPDQHRTFRIYNIDDGITQSILSGFMACRKKMEYTFNGWRTVGTKSVLTFGSVFHYLLEHMTNLIIENKIGSSFSPRKFAQTMITTWIKDETKKGRLGSPDEYEEAVWQSRRAAAIFEVYCEVHKKDFTKIKWESVESKFDIWWHTPSGNKFRLRGMRDGLFRRVRKYWLFETKTKGKIDEGALMAKVNFDFQSLYYLLTLRLELDEMGDDTPCAGVLYNVVRNPSLKLTQKENKDGHLLRIQDDARDRVEHYFMRYEASFSESVQEKFRRELEFKLLEFKAWCNGQLPTYRNEGSCVGLWNCGFLSACGSNSMAGYVDNGKMFTELE